MNKIINKKPQLRILCFLSNYLPGSRSGGPVRTIANFVDQLGDEFDIHIICSDRDLLDSKPYPNVVIDEWNRVGKAKVFYASKNFLNLKGVAKLIAETPHDVLYLNSFFSLQFSIMPLIARRIRMAPDSPCVIAPRGEFSIGAIALKAIKKHFFIHFSKLTGLHRDLIWQASSILEKEDILREFDMGANSIIIAQNLTPIIPIGLVHHEREKSDNLRLVFLSRICPKKNLDFLLRVLCGIRLKVELDIYGPLEDLLYWKKCEYLLSKLPSNVRVKVGTHVPQEEVRDILSQYDLFVFPTRGENFGHVIFESLSVGTPVLVSDQTPWQADANGGMKVLPLLEGNWVSELVNWATMSQDSYNAKRSAALEYAMTCIANVRPLQQNKDLFNFAARRCVPNQ